MCRIFNLSKRSTQQPLEIDMKNATYIEKDQNWTDGSTTYWFEFEGETYGVVEGENAGLVDSESMPLDSEAQYVQDRISQACVVTDAMRAE